MTMKKFKQGLVAFVYDEEAPTMFEYGLMVLVIALAVVTLAAVLGVSVSQFFQDAASAN